MKISLNFGDIPDTIVQWSRPRSFDHKCFLTAYILYAYSTMTTRWHQTHLSLVDIFQPVEFFEQTTITLIRMYK